MKINPTIESLLANYGIDRADGVSYLLSVYFEARPSYTPTILVQKINVTSILGLDSDKRLMWNVPLFEGTTESKDKWEWVADWMKEFGHINKARKGTKSACMARMKNFFASNPDVRKEDVIEATRMYFRTVSDPAYLITSHYFILKGVGKTITSPLEEWIERYQEENESNKEVSNNHISNMMQ